MIIALPAKRLACSQRHLFFSFSQHFWWQKNEKSPNFCQVIWKSKHIYCTFWGGRCFIGFSPEDVVDPFGRLESGNGPEPPVGWCGLWRKNLQVERSTWHPTRAVFMGFPKTMESSFRDLEVHEICNLYPFFFRFFDYFTASRQTTLIVYPLSISTICQLLYLLFLYNLLLGKAGGVPGHKTVAVVVGFWSK